MVNWMKFRGVLRGAVPWVSDAADTQLLARNEVSVRPCAYFLDFLRLEAYQGPTQDHAT